MFIFLRPNQIFAIVKFFILVFGIIFSPFDPFFTITDELYIFYFFWHADCDFIF